MTKDGSKITDWWKFKTQSIKLSSGQKVQIHFYKNKLTGEVNYAHSDFKVKGIVNEFYTPHPMPNSRYKPLIPQDILEQYKPKF